MTKQLSEPLGDCSLCQGGGYVRKVLPLDHPEFGQAIRCPSCYPTPEDLTRGLPRRFQDVSFDTFDRTRNPKMDDAYGRARAVALGHSVQAFLFGGPGLGKTHLAIAAVKLYREEGGTAYFWEVPELLAYLRSSFNPSAEPGILEERIRQFGERTFLLALDDLGAHKPSEWAEEQLFRVLNRRYAEEAPTIITSNASVDVVDARIRSRFREGLVHCQGKDVR